MSPFATRQELCHQPWTPATFRQGQGRAERRLRPVRFHSIDMRASVRPEKILPKTLQPDCIGTQMPFQLSTRLFHRRPLEESEYRDAFGEKFPKTRGIVRLDATMLEFADSHYRSGAATQCRCYRREPK